MAVNHRAMDEPDIELIERVKRTPSLYDPRNPDFRLAYRKEQDWETVAEHVGLSAADARRRWTCLRDRYSRELKQMRMHPEKAGFGQNDFFKQMDFLRRFVRKRRERRSMSSSCAKLLKKVVTKLEREENSTCGGSVQYEDSEQEHENEIRQQQTTAKYGAQIYIEPTQHNYENRVQVTPLEVEDYPEYVEDGSGSYEDYAEPDAVHTANGDVTLSTGNTKSSGNGLVPLVTLPSSSGTMTVSSTPPQQQHHLTQASSQQQEQSVYPHHMISGTIQQSHLHKSQNRVSALLANTLDNCISNETEDDFFSKSVAAYLRQLSRRHKIKAKVEMLQILEKYIDLEESGQND